MKNYLIYSTLFAIFSESLMYKSGVDIKFFYLIVLINTILLVVKNCTYYIPKTWGIVLFLFLGLGIISIFKFENNLKNVLLQIVGISVISIYFYNFFSLFKLDIRDIFRKYCLISYWLSIIGIIIFIYNFTVVKNFEYRLHSLLKEPAHFGGIILPAFAFLLFNYKRNIKKIFVIGVALICTFSSITYVGMLAILFSLQKRANLIRLLFITITGIIFGIVIYNKIENVKIRVDDTFNVISSSELNFEGVNLSTYAILSNLYVAGEVFKSSPIIGHGIGSHPISHKKYISNLTGIDTFEIWDLADTNSTDANSFFIRTVSELGLVGIILIFIFIHHINLTYQNLF